MKKNKILIVEDDDLLRCSIHETLILEYRDVLQAPDVQSGLSVCERINIDLVILDYIMPGLDGIDAISHFRSICPNVSIILITAYATVDVAVEAMQKGANQVITKPFDLDKLLVTTAKCLAQREIVLSNNIDASVMYNALSHPIRRQVIMLLTQRSALKFTEIFEELDIEDHTKLNFHLQSLKKANVLVQDGSRRYKLTQSTNQFLNNRTVRDSLMS